MKHLTTEVDDKKAYILPIGDLHIGDKSFKGEAYKKLMGYLKWVDETPEARIFLNGDIFNCASRLSKTSPFETDSNEYIQAVEIFKPYRDRIIGAIDGNHEARMMDMFGVSPTQHFCMALDIPYAGWSALVELKVLKRKNNRASHRQIYYLYFHHTTGGGGTLGSKMNRVAKLREIIEGIDVYCGSHNHQLGAMPLDVFYPAPTSKEGIGKRRMWFVDCGGYVGWEGSYAEKSMLSPSRIGSPRIRFDGQHHDIHVSI